MSNTDVGTPVVSNEQVTEVVLNPRVLEAVTKLGPVARAELLQVTGYSKEELRAALQSLVKSGQVKVTGKKRSTKYQVTE